MTAKCPLFFYCMVIGFNILYGIVGLSTVTTCSLAIRTLHSHHLTYCIFGIVVGAITFMVSCFGCIGKHYQLRKYYQTYIILLIILLAVQLTVVISFHSKNFVKTGTDIVEKLWHNEVNGAPGSMAAFEIDNKCCGLHSPKDYPNANLTIPKSCYIYDGNNTVDHAFEVGCFEKVESNYAYASNVIKATMWILCGIEGTVLVTVCLFGFGILFCSFCVYCIFKMER